MKWCWKEDEPVDRTKCEPLSGLCLLTLWAFWGLESRGMLWLGIGGKSKLVEGTAPQRAGNPPCSRDPLPAWAHLSPIHVLFFLHTLPLSLEAVMHSAVPLLPALGSVPCSLTQTCCKNGSSLVSFLCGPRHACTRLSRLFLLANWI